MNQNNKPTIKDVSRKAGFSITTVSQILNHKGQRFPPETQRLVQAAAEELGYVANFSARNTRLATQQRTIGVLVPQIQNPFFGNLFRGIQDYIYNEAIDAILVSTDSDQRKAHRYLEHLIQRSVDGFIIATQLDSQDPLLQKLQRMHIPYVLLDQNEGDEVGDQIIVNEQQGGHLVAEHLAAVKQGPIILVVPQQQSSNIQTRIAAVRAGLAQHQIPAAAIYDYQVADLTKLAGTAVGKQIMADFAGVSALTIWAVDDEVAIGITKAIQQAHKQIPATVKLMGYDDTDYAEYLNLTTIHQPITTMGHKAAELLKERLEDPTRLRQVIINDVKLIQRGSTK
ncbi:LacI family DNA-binding transcriptional regulator [Loigolactobacillus zhaoyuanensis]|uniref:LacI family DNA-binding transcriptional regulator n=1 Tax=Loigolactobacillus zhaoyuanensis TaxID=2486017 RepID=A0ABW8UA80_9LACO|nr:LacI family DNA-binding transcriptional regulator [Loigolactobacillus zhaoyuanensis]